MASKITCDNCEKDVIINGKQVRAYYEYDALPFPVAVPSPDRRAVICTGCDADLRAQSGLSPRAARGRSS